MAHTKYDQQLVDALRVVVATKHLYVNATLRRLATAADKRLSKKAPKVK